MKTSESKHLEDQIKVEELHLNDLEKELRDTYLSVKDFNADAITTDKAIQKMGSLNTKIKAQKRKIQRLNEKKK